MNPSRIFILRPVATALLMVAILLVGIVAYLQLPLSALPEVAYPTIQVQTFYPGASPEVITSAITAPLEKQFGQMPGLDQMSSTSSAGASVITLQFDLSLPIDIAEQQVQAAISAAQSLVPQDLPAPPIYAKVNPADAPVLTLGLTSKVMPLTAVEDMADTRIAQKISQLRGVGVVSISGGQRPAVRVLVNPQALAAYGLNLDDLRTTISVANQNGPKGTFDGPTRAYTINANDQLRSAAEYGQIVVAYRNSAAVRLSDVAKLVQGAENTKLGGWMNNTPALLINVQRQPNANVVDVVNSVKALLPSLQASLPAGVEVKVLTDRTTTIRASIRDVQFELALAVALVVLVIFLFLRNVPATVIPALSVPLSLVGTFGIMYLAHFSLNNLSLMALTIATGFVVDDAIVMIENITRFLEQGDKPLDAALKGSKQIGFTIISLTASLVAVLIPLLFMEDVVGRLFREFAATLAVTILISAVVSLTLVPMMCARLLRSQPAVDGQVVAHAAGGAETSQWYKRLVEWYGRRLSWVLDHQPLTLGVAVGTLLLTALLYIVIPKGFFPTQDTGVLQGVSEATQSVSYAAMADRQQALGAAILKDADVESLSSFIGVDGSNVTLNSGRFLINLKPRGERSGTAAEIARRIQNETNAVPGITLYLQPVQDLTLDATISRTQYQFTLQASDTAMLSTWTPKLVDALRNAPEFSDVTSNQEDNGLAASITIDRDSAARFGISVGTVDNALYDAFGQRIVSTIFTQANQYRVILEADPSLQGSLQSLASIYVPSSGGGQVPLTSIASVQEDTRPLLINHQAQFPASTVSFNLAPRVSLGAGVDAVVQAEKTLGLPASISTTFQGAALAFRNNLGNELWLLLAAVVVMYIVLGVLYESFIHPITILSTLPSAGIGALLALMLFGEDLTVIALIGIILLIGIVKKNAILMIDFAIHAERNEGKSPREAIYQACLLRFRPILMTTVAAMFGAIPLMLGTGTGSELRNPLGVSIVGGLAVSQVLTLFTTPVIYLYFDRLGQRIPQPAPRMNLSAPFIARPVATTLLTLGVALAGTVAFNLLPVARLPQIDAPAISVSASIPGASPEVMASSVATPLERHLGAIADVDDMTSTSSVGNTNIQLTFGLDRDIDGAARDVQAAIVAARADLPSSMTRNPSYRKFNSSSFPVLQLAMTSDVLTQGQIFDAADAVLSQRLSQIKGVGSVNVVGGALPAVRVELNPLTLSKYGIGLQDIRAAISNANANAPKGAIESATLHYQVYTNDNARTAADYRSLIVANRNRATVRLGDVATVTDINDGATENIRNFGLFNGKPAVQVQVYQQPGANIIEVVDAVQAELPQLQREIDPKIDLAVTNNRSVTIRASLRQVERTLVLAVLLVILVVYVFLRSARAALIPAVVVPVSLIGTFGAMYLLGYSLNNFSLMALTIATGFVVDDAIVVMENTTRHIEAGMPRLEAALLGAREVGFTVVSMSLSLVAVFIPFQLLSGIYGRLFKEFTITLSIAILISLVISLTTTPMMCARLAGRNPHGKPSRWGDAFERGFAAMNRKYQKSLAWALDHGRLMLLLLFATLAFNIYLYVVIPKGLLPQQDTGQLRGGIRGDATSSFQLMKGKFTQVVDIIRADPAVATVVGSVGGGGGGPGGGGGGASANVSIQLKPLSERHDSAERVIARLRPKMAQVTGVQSFLQAVQDIGGGGGGRSANSEYQYTLLGDDLDELRDWSAKLRKALQDIPEVTDVDTDLQPGGLETDLIVDRDAAARLGLTTAQIDNTLGDAFAQAQVSTIYNPYSPQQYHVVMEVAPEFWQHPDVLDKLYVSTSGGAVSGTQATQAVAGTTKLKTAASTSASAVAQDTARNAASNSLANAGRGNTSTGSAVSVSREAVVPFSAFSHFVTGTTAVSVNHTGTSASTSISFNLPEKESLSTALAAIDRTMERIHVPATIHGGSYGTARLFQQNTDNQWILILAALAAVYVVLGILYESYSHPLTIISTLPAAGVGALLALIATGTELSLIAFLGFLLLIGIVKKNAIMMVDFAIDAQRNQGLEPRAAIAQACALRFRPILMTTCAAICGALPLALAYGDGTEMRRPLGISMVGGLLLSQVLTLYTTPVVYLYIDRLRAWKAARNARAAQAQS